MCYVFSFGTDIKPVRTIHILLCENTQHAVSFYFSKKGKMIQDQIDASVQTGSHFFLLRKASHVDEVMKSVS
jgi:hypothetical protein